MDHSISPPCTRQRVLFAALAALLLPGLWIGGCSSSSGDPQTEGEAAPQADAFHLQFKSFVDERSRIEALMLGPGGYGELVATLREMPLESEADVRTWVETRRALHHRTGEILEAAIAHALAGHTAWQAQRSFTEDANADFPWDPEAEEAQTPGGPTGRPLPVSGGAQDDPFAEGHRIVTLGTALLVGGAVTTGALFLRGFGRLARRGQENVPRSAMQSEAGREAVRQSLEARGVSVPPNASAEEIVDIFNGLGYRTRIGVASDMDQWDADQILTGTGDQANLSTQNAQQSRDDFPEIAVDAGEFAVNQTVGMTQQVTGGATSLLPTGVGQAVDGVLISRDAIDLITDGDDGPPRVERPRRTPEADEVSVLVASEERVDLPSELMDEPSPTPPEIARERLEAAQAGDPNVSLEDIIDAGTALAQQVTEHLRATFGPSVQLAERMALTTTTLDTGGDTDSAYEQSARLSIPGFEEGERVDLLALREGRLATEELGVPIGPDIPVLIEQPPLLGTLSISAAPDGEPGLFGTQPFAGRVEIRQVPRTTTVLCQGTNVRCEPEQQSVSAAGTITFRLLVSESGGQLRIVRTDTGERHTRFLRQQAAPVEEPGGVSRECAEAKAHLCSRLPMVGCDISIMDTARERVIDACGRAEANRFFAAAPGQCGC